MLMTSLFFLSSLILISYWMFPIIKEKGSLFTLFLLLMFILGISLYTQREVIGWLSMIIVMDLYLLFYAASYEHFRSFLLLESLMFTISCLISTFTDWRLFPIPFASGLYLSMLLVKGRSKPLFNIGILGFSVVFYYLGMRGYEVFMQFCTLAMLLMMEYQYQTYAKSFDKDTADFQNQVMSHHYEEVKSVYLNMRGWRHDYHNHIQTMKAYLQLQQYDQMDAYLNELETDLKKVDQLVKSGNLMVDAILNSKLSLASDHRIRVDCKAIIPDQISISDIDICVIIGNLMDNAIEACDKIPEELRRIRFYADIVHQQFYVSITNSAAEDLSEGQKRYISEKRGNHGHGMKRVKLTVDKYDGYLNLKNEPGVFVSELMIPLKSTVS